MKRESLLPEKMNCVVHTIDFKGTYVAANMLYFINVKLQHAFRLSGDNFSSFLTSPTQTTLLDTET